MTTATKGRMRKGAAILMALTMACCLANAQSTAMLKKINGTTRLVQDGQPMVLLGGELHNSTSSTPSSFKKALETVRAMGLNALIGSVSWEQVEPQEGRYDFNVLDSMIYMADEARMPLVLIWFASYKNGESSYAPLWVKKDTKRWLSSIFVCKFLAKYSANCAMASIMRMQFLPMPQSLVRCLIQQN